MEIKFIGTGSGKTSLKRFHSSLLFSLKEYRLLVDAGDGISKALLSQNIHFNSIEGIVISHLHPDHSAGLNALIVQMKLNQRKNKLDVFIHQSLVNVVRDSLYRSYLFKEKLNFEINFIEYTHGEEIEICKNFNFISKQNSHLDKYKIYDHSHSLSFSCSSFLFGYNGKNIFYTGDIGKSDDMLLFSDRKIEIIISEISHIEFQEIIDLSNQLKAKLVHLTHISDEDEVSIKEFMDTKLKNVKGKYVTAYDGLTLDI